MHMAGATRDAPNLLAMPTATRSAPTMPATVSADPKPFWMVSTGVAGPSIGRAWRAPTVTSAALTASTIRSIGSSGAVVLARSSTTRS